MKSLKKNTLQSIVIITNQYLLSNNINIDIIGDDLLIDWGDGNVNDQKYHQYTVPKAYLIKISASHIFKLDLTGQHIKMIKFENCNDLYSLNCQFNNISELDISGLCNIEHLKCNDNKISHIKFGKHDYLYSLNCEGNQLYSLFLSGHADNLQILSCAENNILNFSVNSSCLWRIDIRKNPLDMDTIINNLPDNSSKYWLLPTLLFDDLEYKYLERLQDKNWTLRKVTSIQ